MAPRSDYTTHDTAGYIVKAGDKVTIAFEAEVRSVSRDGLVIVKTANGGITAFYPDYQAMHKLHNDSPKSGED